jgi:hypothetical protein
VPPPRINVLALLVRLLPGAYSNAARPFRRGLCCTPSRESTPDPWFATGCTVLRKLPFAASMNLNLIIILPVAANQGKRKENLTGVEPKKRRCLVPRIAGLRVTANPSTDFARECWRANSDPSGRMLPLPIRGRPAGLAAGIWISPSRAHLQARTPYFTVCRAIVE